MYSLKIVMEKFSVYMFFLVAVTGILQIFCSETIDGPFLQGRSGEHLHVTGVQRNGAAYRVQGYIEGSTLGELRLPDDLHIVKEDGVWKWQGE